MKKLIALLLSMLLLVAVFGCSNSNSHNDGDSDSDKVTTAPTDPSTPDNPIVVGDVSSQADVENAIVAYLSIFGVNSISLCGGTGYSYKPADEYGFFSDTWTITDPDMGYSELSAHISDQLLPLGFTENFTLWGNTWTKKVGFKNVGLTLGYIEEGDNEYEFSLTHAPSFYTAAYIAESSANMPVIIEGDSALDAFPENFSITWRMSYGLKQTICRYNGSWFFCYDSTEQEDYSGSVSYTAAVLQSDGSYCYYMWGGSDSTPRQTDNLGYSNKTLEEYLEDYVDKEAYDSAGISTYLQMCKDYNLGSSFGPTNYHYGLGENIVMTDSVVIAGVTCQVLYNSSLWSEYEFAFDPQTGLLFRYSENTDSDSSTPMEVLYEVIDYTDSPTSLGTFVQP